MERGSVIALSIFNGLQKKMSYSVIRETFATGKLLGDFWGYVAVLIASIWPLIFARYGFDVSDTGWYAVLSRDFFARPDIVASVCPWYMTWAVSACLGKIDSDHIWMVLRIAGFLPYMLSTIAVVALAVHHKSSKFTTGVGVLCASILSYSDGGVNTLNYNTVSVAFACIGIAFCLIGSERTKKKYALLLCAGFFIGLSTASRLSNLLLMGPAILSIVLVQNTHDRIKRIATVLLGFGVSVCFIATFAAWAGNLTELEYGMQGFILGSVFHSNHQTSHSVGNSFHIWVYSFRSVIVRSVGVVTVLAILRALFHRHVMVYRVLSFVVLFLIAISTLKHNDMFVAFPLIIVGITCLEQKRTSWTFQNPLLRTVITGLLFAVLFPLGSMNGFANSLYAFWFVLPFLPQLVSDTWGRVTVVISLTVLAILAAGNSQYPYWDHKISDLHCQFESGSLSGVHSQCSRITDVDGAVNAIQSLSNPTDRIFIAQNSPGLYVLSGRQVWGDAPWPFVRPAGYMSNLFAQGLVPPKLFVMDKIEVLNPDWPNGKKNAPSDNMSGTKNNLILCKEYLDRNGYIPVYQNSTWIIYRRPS